MGGISGVVLPDPIPNSEVKRAWADDSYGFYLAKVGSCPLIKDLSKTERSF